MASRATNSRVFMGGPGQRDDERSRLLMTLEEEPLQQVPSPPFERPSLTSLFERPASTAQIRPYESFRTYFDHSYRAGNDAYDNTDNTTTSPTTTVQDTRYCRCPSVSGNVLNPRTLASTVLGGSVFLLYQIVFCLAQAAAITRPHASHATTGLMAQTAALGVLVSGPMFVYAINIPAIYPASDLFLAPFLAKIAERIDNVLFEHDLQDHDRIFLATFGVVTGAAFLLSGTMCILAARFKLANLGAFLPYSVLCGLFATIGVLMWTLGFNVDTNQKVGEVLFSGDWSVIRPALIHHAPSLGIGIMMHFAGRSSPLLVIFLVLATIFGSYAVMWVLGVTLEQATEANWFYSVDDLMAKPSVNSAITPLFGPPFPFGVIASLVHREVFWKAVVDCMPTIIALAFLYLIRCSLHSAALRKNAASVTRKTPEAESPDFGKPIVNQKPTMNLFIRPTVKVPSLGQILEHGYGYSQLAAALFGGITVAPSVAASITMFNLGAEGPAPQYLSCLLVLVFYVSNFQFVQYIPKPAFSCLMVLAGLDMCRTWVVGSFLKTKSKIEWLVTPFLVVMALCVGLLPAIFLGVAVSTFIFAATFYRSGIVRFVGNGFTLRSTVERGVVETTWLDQNAHFIQILVLHNYIFFGNAQSVLNYVTTMFEETDVVSSANAEYNVPPVPVFLIIDFTMVSGADTSSIDLFRDIAALCKDNKCSLYLAGLGSDLKADLIFAGIKPVPGSSRIVFVPDLETALAKAEDGLLSAKFRLEEKDELESSLRRKKRRESNAEDGFIYALEKIDEQHNLNTVSELCDFRLMTTPVELEPDDILVREEKEGLYFVETGLLRIQHASGQTTRNLFPFAGGTSSFHAGPASLVGSTDPTDTLSALNARTRVLVQEVSLWQRQFDREQGFRLARIGQGSIIGSVETASGLRIPGVYVAMSSCRLHHLPPSAIREAERSNPPLAMHLYKTISHLATKREEVTIQQLGQFNRILNSPTPRLRGGRSDLGRLHNA